MIRWLCILLGLAGAEVCQAAPEFEASVAPLISAQCVECHNATEKSGGLDLTTRESALLGGDSGAVINPTRPEESLLYERVFQGEMPPAKAGKSHKLPEAEIATLREWITAGATWPEGRVLDLYERTNESRAGRDWWPLQPIRRPARPSVHSADRVQTPVDAFILAQLESDKFTLAPPADKRTLVRRAFVDLLGLPPTSEQIDEFVRDESPDAFEKLIDRLLASPHYGERWGRYWLDVVRFAETCGYERD